MPKKRPTPEQIVLLLRQIEVATSQGKSIAIACREAGIPNRFLMKMRGHGGIYSPTSLRQLAAMLH